MEIDLLSEMVKELILDNDEVTLPGLGTFVSEVVPSAFSDKGYTINPPYRKLYFRQRNETDTKLADFYAKVNGTSKEAAEKIVTEFVAEVRNTLQTRKVVAFPGLGRLRATKENAFFFIPDEDLDIYPYGIGLEPVSLKTHEETPEEVHAAVEGLSALVDIPEKTEPEEEPAPAVEPQVPSESEASTEKTEETKPVEKDMHHRHSRAHKPVRTALITAACVLAAVFMFLAVFIVLSRVAPDFIDNLLYTKEQLEIINY